GALVVFFLVLSGRGRVSTSPERRPIGIARKSLHRVGRWLSSPLIPAAIFCLGLASFAMVSGGWFDSPAARDVRASSVSAAAGSGLDELAAEQIVANRRLVVVMLEPGADPAGRCDSFTRSAAGSLVVVLA